jgi:hypothetical protein
MTKFARVDAHMEHLLEEDHLLGRPGWYAEIVQVLLLKADFVRFLLVEHGCPTCKIERYRLS